MISIIIKCNFCFVNVLGVPNMLKNKFHEVHPKFLSIGEHLNSILETSHMEFLVMHKLYVNFILNLS